jgi:DNA-binding transcriptional LysR family regulator
VTAGSKEPSLAQLRMLVIMADELNFARTARRVHLSQPAVSRQIAALEHRLGVQLFERTTRGVALTEPGRALIDQSRAVVQAVDRLLVQATRECSQGSGTVVIGSFEAVNALPPIPRILEDVRAAHPRVGLQIRRLGFSDFGDAILEGEVDAAFVFLPVTEGIQVQPLHAGARCVAMSSNDVLASESMLTMAQLGSRPYVGMSERTPQMWRRFWSFDPRPDGSRVRFSSHRVADFESALPLIALGDGIQLPPAAARYLYPRPGVAYVDASDLPGCLTALAWLPQNRDRPVVRSLRHLARAHHDRGLRLDAEP